MGVMNSFFHWVGQVAFLAILLIKRQRGVASSTENSLVNSLGKSSGTPDRGFFAALIFYHVSSSLIVGGGRRSDFNFVCTRAGSWSTESGGN
jgi:hypothetical protein